MTVVVVFWDSAVSRGSLQEFSPLNHKGHLLDYSRRHGDRRYRPLSHHSHPAAGPAVAADADDDRQGHHELFLQMTLFVVHSVGKRDDFISRMKSLDSASPAAATSEVLGFSFSGTPYLCFALSYFADDSQLLIFCSTFLPPFLVDMERCLCLGR